MTVALPVWVLAAFIGHSIRTGHAQEHLSAVLQMAAAVLLAHRKGKHAKPFSWPRHVPFVGGDGQHTDIGLAESAPTPSTKLETAS